MALREMLALTCRVWIDGMWRVRTVRARVGRSRRVRRRSVRALVPGILGGVEELVCAGMVMLRYLGEEEGG